MDTAEYDPFARGRFPVGVRTIRALDPGRGRLFPCEIWYPARDEEMDRTAGSDPGRDVKTMYLAAENDTPIPLAGVYELFDRTPASKRMFILRRADHQHFVDDVEGEHEAIRAMSFPGGAAWIPAAMLPMAELCSGEEAHLFVRGLTLAHLDATLRRLDAAERFLTGDVESELAARGVEAIAHRP